MPPAVTPADAAPVKQAGDTTSAGANAPLGIVAGKGDISLLLARETQHRGREVVAVTYYKEIKESLSEFVDKVTLLGVAQVGATLDVFEKEGVDELCLIGKIDKRAIYEKPKADMTGLKILAKLALKNDDSLVLGVIEEIESRGFTVASQEELLRNLMPTAGNYSKRRPTNDEQKDIAFGMAMAKGIAKLDIGQTVVVKGGAVVAAEAIEGTDETIARGGAIAKKGCVVCKVSKPAQDPRFDLPTVGVDTVKAMESAKASVLAIEADKTLVVDLPAVTKECDRVRIAFVAVTL